MKKSPVEKMTKSAASSRVVSVRLSQSQLDRLTLVAALLQTTVDRLLLSATLAELDGSSSWHEFTDFTQAQLELYADGKATCKVADSGIELTAPNRLLRLAGMEVSK